MSLKSNKKCPYNRHTGEPHRQTRRKKCEHRSRDWGDWRDEATVRHREVKAVCRGRQTLS